jgi:hypothetical protein
MAKTEEYQISRYQRKKVEMLFAHLKRILKLDRLRLRGPNGARDEFHLAASPCRRRPQQPEPANLASAFLRTRRHDYFKPDFFNTIGFESGPWLLTIGRRGSFESDGVIGVLAED